MKILAISGSTRRESTNTALLNSISRNAPQEIELEVFESVLDMPIFTIDLETINHPQIVKSFANKVAKADAVIFAVPEYVRTLPGGLKNAIDWLVPREELIEKPIGIIHASWRGDDMLADLRRVLATVSSKFCEDIFLRIPVANKTSKEIEEIVQIRNNKKEIDQFFRKLVMMKTKCHLDYSIINPNDFQS